MITLKVDIPGKVFSKELEGATLLVSHMDVGISDSVAVDVSLTGTILLNAPKKPKCCVKNDTNHLKTSIEIADHGDLSNRLHGRDAEVGDYAVDSFDDREEITFKIVVWK